MNVLPGHYVMDLPTLPDAKTLLSVLETLQVAIRDAYTDGYYEGRRVGVQEGLGEQRKPGPLPGDEYPC